jgi:hypothetical protein
MVQFTIHNRAIVNVVFNQITAAMTMTPTVLLIGRLEAGIGQILLKRSGGVRQPNHHVDVFVITQALIGIALGISNQPPATIDEHVLAERITVLLGASSRPPAGNGQIA